MEWPLDDTGKRVVPPLVAEYGRQPLVSEQLLLTAGPTLLVLAFSSFYLRQCYSQPVRVQPNRVLRLKLAMAGVLIATELISFGVRHSTLARRGSEHVAISASPSFSALLIGIVINAEHRRCLRSSALPGILLLVCILSDLTKIRNLHCQHNTSILIWLSLAAGFIKSALICLLETTKRNFLSDTELQDAIDDELISGLWRRSFSAWINGTMRLVFGTVVTIDDLDSLGPDFCPERLSTALYQNLREFAYKGTRHSLLKSTVGTFDTEFFSHFLPRLCFTCFKFTQPILLRHAIMYIGGQDDSVITRIALLATALLIFLGIALSRAASNHTIAHFTTTLRGAVIPMVVQKSLVLPQTVVKESAALALMDMDIEGISSTVLQFHILWSSCFEVLLATYILASDLDDAAFYFLIPLVSSMGLSFGLQSFLNKSSKLWNEATQQRISKTTQALLQIQSIKMVGLEGAVSNLIQKLRVGEIACLKHFKLLSSITTSILAAAYAFTPIVAIGTGLFCSPSSGSVTPVRAFTTLAVAALTINPLMAIPRSYRALKASVSSFGRIETYLLKPEVNSEQFCDSDGNPLPKGETEPSGNGFAIEFDGVSIAPSLGSVPVFNDINLAVQHSRITSVLGEVGSGKTTLLRAMIREAPIIRGRVLCKEQIIAYSGQHTWLRNTSIRKNIIGLRPFDPVWYEVVVNCCALNADFLRLPSGDSYIVGINGARLSGGQKYRVSLARVLYLRASIIVLDDIYRGLDAATAEYIHNRLFGPKGMLRTSAATVVFATHSVAFMKTAHQAFILGGNGAISVHGNPSAITLTKPHMERLAQREDTGSTPLRNAEPDEYEATINLLAEECNERLHSGRYVILYRYFSSLASSWRVHFWLLSMAMLVSTERAPEIFVRVWLEFHAANYRSFIVYASIGASSVIVSIGCLWLTHQKIFPENALRLHQSLLDSVMRAPISFLATKDIGSIMNRFGQDMTNLTLGLPTAFFHVAYLTIYVIYDASIIISGLKYAASLAPFLILLIYVIKAYYLQASQRLRHLDTEAKMSLYTLFTEMATGLEHVRAFGWQSALATEITLELDNSQKSHFYTCGIQRWLELATDFSSLGLAVALLWVTTIYKDSTNEAAMGLTMLNLVTFGNMMKLAVAAWGSMDAALGAVTRFRNFVSSIPSETREDEVQLPALWPQSGNIVFSNVTARYSPTDTIAVLNNFSLRIDEEEKVGITGRTGSGKTSVLCAMLRLMEYTGTITIDGVDISTISPRTLRSRITTISQDTISLEGTIRENILPYEGQLEDETIHDELVFEALDKVELTDVVESRGGLDTPLSSLGLSGGQMQLLALARAIMHNTCTQSKVVLLDEPTSSMDAETDSRIQDIIEEEFVGCTKFIVSHRSDTFWDASRLLEVRNGHVVELPIPERPDDEDSD